MLTEIEAKTLDALYPDKAAYFEYLWILSDRVQEDGGEVAAEGVRVLCRSEQRPYWLLSDEYTYSERWKKCWWYDIEKELKYVTDCYYNNYLPTILGLGFDDLFPTPSASLQEFLKRWCGLDQETRDRISKEWVLEKANN